MLDKQKMVVVSNLNDSSRVNLLHRLNCGELKEAVDYHSVGNE